MNNLAHDMAMTVADAETVDLRDSVDDAYYAHVEARKAHDEAHNAAYDKAYERLEKQYGDH